MTITLSSAPKKMTLYVQVLVIASILGAIIVLSYLLANKRETSYLEEDAISTLHDMQTNIEFNMQEAGVLLGTISESVRLMILRGAKYDDVAAYIKKLTNYMSLDENFAVYTLGVFGVFDVFDERHVTAFGWEPPSDYVYKERPWYSAAIEANGAIGVTEPYMDAVMNVYNITYARHIFDEEGKPLGIVCFDLKFDKINEYLNAIRDKRKGFPILLDAQYMVIYNSDTTQIGKKLHKLPEQDFTFFKQLKNGWHIGIAIPKKRYYDSITHQVLALGILGLVSVAVLAVLMLRIARTRKEKEHAEQASRFKSQFLSRMSHEIRTPINAILGATEIQLMKETLAPDVQDAFLMINNSGDLLLSIINNILDLSKIESNKMEIIPVTYDVSSLVNDTVQLNLMQQSSKPIEFELYVDENIPLRLVGDEIRIKQILNNLLSNAFKYTGEGTVKLSITVENTQNEADMILVLCVSDTGQGMTSEQLNKLFNEYYRFNQEINYAIEGTGLGMNITKNLVNMMHGQIKVKSEFGKGSTFTVRLPQKRATGSCLGKERAQNLMSLRIDKSVQIKRAQFVREHMPYGSVLIVDDVESNLYVASGLLSPYGLSIDTAESGFEAIAKVKSGKVYDIIFMDHMMPAMDGIETVKRIRSMGYLNPIIALTANAVAGQAEIFLSNGFDDFISKPIDVRVLNNVLNKMIRDK